MEFIATPTFIRLVTQVLTGDENRALQNVLVEDPERGDLVQGGGVSQIQEGQPDAEGRDHPA